MNAPVTRRALLGATSTALGAVSLPAAALALASPTPDPDADLVALIARHTETLAALNTLDEASTPFRDRYFASMPDQPAALLWRWSDVEHEVGPASGKVQVERGTRRGSFACHDVERLRTAPPLTKWGRFADDEEPCRVPDPAGEARRWEIVEAHDAWMAEKKALADRIGLTEANAACDRLSDIVCDIEMAIMDRAPVTLDGFRAKARWIAASKQPEGWAEALLRDLCGGVSS